MKKNIKVRQLDQTDCGPACLASIAAWYGLKIPVSRLRLQASTGSKGTNLLGMIEAARTMGMQAMAVRTGFKELVKLNIPVILHLKYPDGWMHFVVLYKCKGDRIKIMDPADGQFYCKKRSEIEKLWSGICLLVQPDADFDREILQQSPFKKFMNILLPHRNILIQALWGAMAFSLLGLSVTVFVQNIIDRVLGDGNIHLLNILGMAMVILLIIRIFIGFTKDLYLLKVGQKIDNHLIMGYLNRLIRLPQKFFDSMQTGEIASRLYDAIKIRSFLNQVSLEWTVNAMMFTGSLLLMLTFSWRLSVIVVAMLPVFLLIYILFNRSNRKHLRILMESGAAFESQILQTIHGIRTIKQFDVSDWQMQKSSGKYTSVLQESYRVGKSLIFTKVGCTFFASILTIIVLWKGALLVMDQTITPGQLISFYALLGYLISPLTSLIQLNRNYQDAIIATDRLFQVIDLDAEEKCSAGQYFGTLKPSIEMNKVDFGYGGQPLLFENLNLKIYPGETIAITGASGSGKSSLGHIIQKTYPIAEGSVSIGKVDLNLIPLKILRGMIGVVPQKIELFRGSILENITLSEYGADIQKVLSLCYALGLEEKLGQLPDGIMSPLGETGTGLSGGEMQRLAIARALYREPRILILDEAFSALDRESLDKSLELIRAWKTDQRTLIIINHDLEYLKEIDRIFQVTKGCLVAQDVYNRHN